jgi:hypothetical protein
LVPVSMAALLAIGRKRAAWWSIPALWPASQFHYSVFAMPSKMTTLAAAALALPVPGAPVLAVVIEGLIKLVERRMSERRASDRGLIGAGTRPDTSAGSAAATSEA